MLGALCADNPWGDRGDVGPSSRLSPYLVGQCPGSIPVLPRSPGPFRVRPPRPHHVVVSAYVRLYSGPGNDLTYRFPLIVGVLGSARSRSCIIDGEAVACDESGVPSFDRIYHRHHDAALDLI